MPVLAPLITAAIAASMPTPAAPWLAPDAELLPARVLERIVEPPGRHAPLRRRCYVGQMRCGVPCLQLAARSRPRQCDRYPPRTPRVVPLR